MMKLYVVLFTKVDFITVEAETKQEALKEAHTRLLHLDPQGNFHIEDVQEVPETKEKPTS